LVKEKNGELRFCVDFTKLNDVTKKGCFPLPRIHDTLDTLAGAKWYPILDLKSGYWQVEVHPDDNEKKRSRQDKDYGTLQSCPLASATLQRPSRG
jgi:hypothetical protein